MLHCIEAKKDISTHTTVCLWGMVLIRTNTEGIEATSRRYFLNKVIAASTVADTVQLCENKKI